MIAKLDLIVIWSGAVNPSPFGNHTKGELLPARVQRRRAWWYGSGPRRPDEQLHLPGDHPVALLPDDEEEA